MTGFAIPAVFAALFAVAVVSIAALRGIAIGRRRSVSMASGGFATKLDRASRIQWVRAFIVGAAIALVVVALARPVGAPAAQQIEARGADVIIAIDVSLSMLARDATPSRLERSRDVLRGLLDRLDGSRVGLVAFSGSSGILLPLTLDTEAARQFADQLVAQSVDEPGTSVDRAVDRSIEMFDSAGEGDRVLVVISDGETQGDDPVGTARDAADRAREADVSIATVTVGDRSGAAIPLDALGSDSTKRDASGAEVQTRARPDVMAALAVNGPATDAKSGDEIDRVASWIESRGSVAEHIGGRSAPVELFQWPLLAALALFAVDYAIGSLKRN